MCEALIPLLELSGTPRIVNVSSSMGKLEVCDSLESQSSMPTFTTQTNTMLLVFFQPL